MGLLGVLLAVVAGAHPGIHEQEREADAALAENPENPDTHLSRGRIHTEKREWDAALASYSRARRLGAAQYRVALLEGTAYLDAGWPQMAKECFAGILETAPNDPAAHLGRARAWMKLDHAHEAAKDYAVAVATLPSLQPGYVLEYRDALIAADRPGDAIVALDAGIARLGQVPALQLAAVDAQVDAKQYDDALRRLELLLVTSPGHPAWSARRGEVLERAGRTEEARLAYADALAHIQVRTSGRRARRLDELEGRVRAALARNIAKQEETP